jgi:hypothetical protein
VEKVAQSKQLGTADHPEILVLFENWLEELESPTTDDVSGLDLQLIFKTLCLSLLLSDGLSKQRYRAIEGSEYQLRKSS